MRILSVNKNQIMSHLKYCNIIKYKPIFTFEWKAGGQQAAPPSLFGWQNQSL